MAAQGDARRTVIGMSAEHDPASFTGKILDGKLVVGERLGGGAMGDVYVAWHRTLEKNVAVKVLQPNLAHDPAFVGRFRREALAASQLEHTHCVRVYDFGRSDGCPYLIMDYVAGIDLQRVLRVEGLLAAEDIASILLQVLDALTAAHALGIVHRDIKPANMLVTESGQHGPGQRFTVKLTDFGIARLSPDRADCSVTSPGMVMGTPEYMSPEQARAEDVDARSDLYALGVVAFQMLTGDVPYDAPTPVALLMRHLTDPIPEPCKIHQGVHAGLAAVAVRAMQKEPRDRYASAREMRDAVLAAMRAPTPRRSTRYAAAIAGVLVSSAAALWLTLAPTSSATQVQRVSPARSKSAPAAVPRSPHEDDAAQRELSAWYAALSTAPERPVAARRPAPAARQKVHSYYDLVAADAPDAAELAAR